MSEIYNIDIDNNEIKGIFAYMNAELNAYNHLVDIFGPQFNRDYKVFLDIDSDMISMFGDMCETPANIYNIKTENLPEHLKKYTDVFLKMSNKVKFLLNEATIHSHILPSIRKRMGMTILKFYIDQSEIRMKNEYIGMDNTISYKGIYNILSTQSSINKKHLQIDRKSCIMEFNKIGNYTELKLPYVKHPIIIPKVNLKGKKWNHIVLKQEDKVSTLNGEWIIELRKLPENAYLYKMIDRITGSYIRH